MQRILIPILAALVAGITVWLFLTREKALQHVADSTSAISIDDPSKLLDLTYSYDEETIYWPTARPFRWEKESWGPSPGGYWYSAARYSASEHGGTHLDSPIHFAENGETADEIPLSRLIGPAVVVDITVMANTNPDYRLTIEDLTSWEQNHGRFPRGAILLVKTGWGRHWPDRKRYLGTDKPGDVAGLRFPGISREAAEWIANRQSFSGVGIDTASIDYGRSTDFIAHRILNGAKIYALENVARLERVPPTGATIFALPMKIRGGSGGPARIIAITP